LYNAKELDILIDSVFRANKYSKDKIINFTTDDFETLEFIYEIIEDEKNINEQIELYKLQYPNIWKYFEE